MFKYLVKPVRRAFLCSDLNLYHPPPEKKVFPTWLLFVCAIIIPLIIVSRSLPRDTRIEMRDLVRLDRSIGRRALVLSHSTQSCQSGLQDSDALEDHRRSGMGR